MKIHPELREETAGRSHRDENEAVSDASQTKKRVGTGLLVAGWIFTVLCGFIGIAIAFESFNKRSRRSLWDFEKTFFLQELHHTGGLAGSHGSPQADGYRTGLENFLETGSLF
jgi:hypothetical protein